MEDIFSQMGAILKGFTIMIIGMGKVFWLVQMGS
jgi:Na+-transporting methylmalonyl-CoA/oxaloacetate decarboxylase gamma subunit